MIEETKEETIKRINETLEKLDVIELKKVHEVISSKDYIVFDKDILKHLFSRYVHHTIFDVDMILQDTQQLFRTLFSNKMSAYDSLNLLDTRISLLKSELDKAKTEVGKVYTQFFL